MTTSRLESHLAAEPDPSSPDHATWTAELESLQTSQDWAAATSTRDPEDIAAYVHATKEVVVLTFESPKAIRSYRTRFYNLRRAAKATRVKAVGKAGLFSDPFPIELITLRSAGTTAYFLPEGTRLVPEPVKKMRRMTLAQAQAEAHKHS